MATGVSTESLGIVSKVAPTKGPKLKIAIVGCGGISQTHMGIWRKMPDVEVVAGVDIVPDRLDNMKEKWDIKKLYTDWKKMLKEVKPDAVDVCTPNGVHAPAAIDASNFGCHVITEKPMSMNPDECQRMIDAAAKAKKKLVVGFQYRYHPNTQIIKRAADAGALGNIMFVKCQALRRRGIPNWGVFGRKELQGGGPMIDIGVHVIEMAHYAIGAPKPVAAMGKTWTYMGNKPSDVMSQWPNWDWKTYTVEDLAIGQIRFANGAIMQIEASFAAHVEKDVWDFTVIGDKGGARWETGTIYSDQAGTMVNSSPAYVSAGDFGLLFDKKLRNFVDGCLYNKPLMAPGEAGIAVQQIIDGVYRSQDNGGKEVAID
jgi:predicted dehydrogenase